MDPDKPKDAPAPDHYSVALQHPIAPEVAAHLAGGPPHVTIGLPGDDLDSLAVDCRGESLDLGPDDALGDLAARMAADGGQPSHVAIPLENVDAAIAAGLDVQFMPATSADLLELDAVPELLDSAERATTYPTTYPPGMAPIGPDAQTRPIRGPDAHARTLARART